MRIYKSKDVVIVVSGVEKRVVIKTGKSFAVLQLDDVKKVMERAKEHLHDNQEALSALDKMLEEELASST